MSREIISLCLYWSKSGPHHFSTYSHLAWASIPLSYFLLVISYLVLRIRGSVVLWCCIAVLLYYEFKLKLNLNTRYMYMYMYTYTYMYAAAAVMYRRRPVWCVSISQQLLPLQVYQTSIPGIYTSVFLLILIAMLNSPYYTWTFFHQSIYILLTERYKLSLHKLRTRLFSRKLDQAVGKVQPQSYIITDIIIVNSRR